ncbi:MAG: hypothetical protein JJE46_07645 [Acidimicrobiia bacterium]|nr:hypothetical protein [Acidimicrobiia bacterium]
MTSLQFISNIGAPATVLLVVALLMVLARPDRDTGGDGAYAVYLSAASLAALYMLLVMTAAGIQAIAEHFARGRANGFNNVSITSFDLFFGDNSNATIGATAAAIVVAAIVYGFHTRRRRELRTVEGHEASGVARVGRAYLGSVCFAMVTILLESAILIGGSAIAFIDTSNDRSRDIAAGTLIGYGLVALVAFLIFRSHFWAFRGTPGDNIGEATGAGDR